MHLLLPGECFKNRIFAFVRKLVYGALKMRGQIVRILPARNTPNFFTERRNRTYPTRLRDREAWPAERGLVS
jgi:hypothetical protein